MGNRGGSGHGAGARIGNPCVERRASAAQGARAVTLGAGNAFAVRLYQQHPHRSLGGFDRGQYLITAEMLRRPPVLDNVRRVMLADMAEDLELVRSLQAASGQSSLWRRSTWSRGTDWAKSSVSHKWRGTPRLLSRQGHACSGRGHAPGNGPASGSGGRGTGRPAHTTWSIDTHSTERAASPAFTAGSGGSALAQVEIVRMRDDPAPGVQGAATNAS